MFKNIRINQVLIAFLFGVAIGAWGIQLRDYGGWIEPAQPGTMRKHMIKKMEHDLGLNAEQKTQMEAIFKTAGPKMKDMRAEMRPKFEALRDETRAEIRKILTPEQMPKFEELNQKMDERWNKYRSKREKV